MGYERVEVTTKPVEKWWGGWRYRVEVSVGLDDHDDALRESIELKPKKYALYGAEAEIVSGAMGRLIPTDALEIVTLDTEGNRGKLTDSRKRWPGIRR